MKKVIYVGYDLEEGRSPHQAMAAIWMALNGHFVYYFTTSVKPVPSWARKISSLKFVSFSSNSRALAGCKLGFALFFRLLKGEVDIVYVQGAQQSVLTFWVPLVFKKIEIIYHTQDFKPDIYWLYNSTEKILARRSDLVICNEINRAKVMQVARNLRRTPEVIRTSLPSKWPAMRRRSSVRSEIMANAVSAGCSVDVDTVLFIAAGGPYFSRRKSDRLMAALLELEEKYVLVFTGMDANSTRRRECIDEAELLGVSERVVVMSRLNYSRLLEVYSACDLGMLLYSDTDLANFYQGPGRLTEYLRSGLPIVSSDFPGLELVVLKYGIGAVADSDSPMEISAAIKKILMHDGQYPKERLIDIARYDICYERDAGRVLSKFFSLSDDYYDHPLWSFLESEYARDDGGSTYG
ncbi:glycosyltransferase [Granulosicoccus sp. 3-233]|uniref:glycosyltransferase n=1 Tax=Granulosicoccus sp. 3-233 TaxID=3417969 RepID=UPI003D338B48